MEVSEIFMAAQTEDETEWIVRRTSSSTRMLLAQHFTVHRQDAL